MRRLFFLATFLISATAAYADHHISRHFETSVPLRDIKRVVVQIPAGEINISNGKANELTASGYIRRECDDDDDDREQAERVVEDVNVEVFTRGDTAYVRRHFGPNARGWSATKFTAVQLDLAVPAGTDLQLETRVGDVRIDGSFGSIDTDLRAGEIHATMPRANVKELHASCRIGEVHTSLGDRTIEREGVFPGTTHFVNPDGGRGKVNLHTTVGEVHVTLTR